MNRRIVALGWVMVVGGVCLGCKPHGVIVISHERFQNVQILNKFNGNDPGLKEPGLRLINSVQDLESLGSYELASHEIDFDRQSLLIFALGEKPTSGYWAKIAGVQREGNLLYVQGWANRPSKDQTVTQVLTYPYAVAVLSKITEVQIRSEIESLVGEHQREDSVQ